MDSVAATRWLLPLVVAIGSFPSSTFGQGATVPVTWLEVDTWAAARARDVVLATARMSTARAEVAVAGMPANPRLTVGATTSSYDVTASLFFALPIFGQRGVAMDAAEAQRRVAAAGLDVARLDATFVARLAWIDLWLLEHEARVALTNLERRARVREATAARFEEGAAARLDVLRADTELNRARAELDGVRDQAAAASARLAANVGQPGDRRFEAQGEPPAAEASGLPQDAEKTIDGHPAVRRVRALVGAASAVVERERRQRWPILGFLVGTSLLNRAPPPNNDVNFSVAFDLPLFNSPLIARARAERSVAEAELAATAIVIRAQIVAARADYLAADRRYQTQKQAVLPAAREAADLAEEGYRSGGLDLTDTLAAEQALSDAELAVLRSAAERGRAFASFQHASGNER